MTLPLATESSFYLDLYARYRRDVSSVPADWRVYFEDLDGPGASPGAHANVLAARLIDAYRRHGHLAATLDPLGLEQRAHAPSLAALRAEAAPLGVRRVMASLGSQDRDMSLAELDAALGRIYAGSIGIEAEQIEDEAARAWLYSRVEAPEAATEAPEAAERALESIALADTFEAFVKVKFPSKKRFGVEGAESLIVLLREMLREACLSGVEETVMGGMHRGRLATLATVLGKPVGILLAEIKGRDLTAGGADYTGDVPYHLGYSGEMTCGDRRMKLSISPHPSHLMTVAPVVTGMARAIRDAQGDEVLCLLLHTDAAFSGQGLVGEVLQLGGLEGYSVGGTIHVVVNNQLGFTTEVAEGRSSRYCTDIGKMIGAPILHVNGDDPLAVLRVARIAAAWRQRYRRDILIDLVCYRRNGHNELDEPRFTQPVAWARVDAKPSLRESFGEAIGERDAAALERVGRAAAAFKAEMQAGYEAIESLRPNTDGGSRSGMMRADADEVGRVVETGVDLDRLRSAGRLASQIPAGIKAHPKVAQFYLSRLEAIERGTEINFAMAEALAFASLLDEGTGIRLSGQDCVRGTFTQRHLAVHDSDSGDSTLLLRAVGRDKAARFDAINSPLSEYAVLGFEYGGSLVETNRLTLWEAQFGDFLNGAQIMVDQFIVSAEAKWGVMSGLVVLLPHGLEGQGPDHSSARIERLLQLCAGGNIIVANPSTPANLFHLLRRQVRAPWRKPLFVISPKALLRQKAAVSTLAEMAPGTGFRPVVADEMPPKPRRVVLCSGKIAYELAAAREIWRQPGEVAIIRIDQLYPFPAAALAAILASRRDAEWVWCQEEPENQGALGFVLDRFGRDPRLSDHPLFAVSRPPLPVAAGGSIERHESEQAALIERALSGQLGGVAGRRAVA